MRAVRNADDRRSGVALAHTMHRATPIVPGHPPVIAHRGGAPGENENSAAAFTHALAQKIDLLECDVRQTADGALVLIHDGIVRLGGRRVPVRQAKLAELQAALPWLLTLSRFLEEFGHQARLIVDLKAVGYERQVREELVRHGVLEQSLVSTVHAHSLRRFARDTPRPRLGLARGHLVTTVPAGMAREAAIVWQRLALPRVLPAALRFARADAVMLQHRLITPGWVRQLHEHGYHVFAWTVDGEAEARRLRDAGVDGITSDYPELIRQALGLKPEAAPIMK